MILGFRTEKARTGVWQSNQETAILGFRTEKARTGVWQSNQETAILGSEKSKNWLYGRAIKKQQSSTEYLARGAAMIHLDLDTIVTGSAISLEPSPIPVRLQSPQRDVAGAVMV